MAKLEIDLPDYMVGKRQKGTRSNGGAPYVLYYWQPWKELRAAGFQSVPLGRDLSKAIATAQRLNDRLSAWRRGEDLDPGLPPKIRGTIPHLIDLYQASEDYLDKAPKTRIGYDRGLEILRQWSANSGHPQVAKITRRGLRELHKALRWPQGEPCWHADGCPADRQCLSGRNAPEPLAIINCGEWSRNPPLIMHRARQSMHYCMRPLPPRPRRCGAGGLMVLR
jgi:hypothetical protein